MKKILIVEDDPTLNFGMKIKFELEKFEVDAVLDGETGLKLANTNYYDFIILDLLLVHLSGFEFIKRYKGTAKIIVVTNGDDTAVQRAKDAGAWKVFKKIHITIDNLIKEVK